MNYYKGRNLNNIPKCKITITPHAKQRLSERLPQIQPRDYETVVWKARYFGVMLNEVSKELEWRINERYLHGNNIQHRGSFQRVTLYKKCIFIFCDSDNHYRKLKTVIDLPEDIVALLPEAAK